MSELKNDRFIRALLRQPVDYTPVWIMRQAGRYLPEYRETRAKAGSFLTLCKTPELACEVTLQPLERFDLDAAILFSDILTIPDAMGLGLYFSEGEGPKFERKIEHEKDVDTIAVVDPEDQLSYVTDAVRLIRKELQGKVPLIGFSGSPWTLACYMVEGGSSQDFKQTKKMLYSAPDILEKLLDKLALSVANYLNAQIRAGAQTVMIFDSWGGALSYAAYQQFSLNPIKKIIENLERTHEGTKIPVIVFTKGGGLWLENIVESNCDAIGLDWTCDIGIARQQVGDKVALQGNLDPAVLHAPPEIIEQEVKKILTSYGKGPGHVFNLGHGITPDINPEHVSALVEAVHKHSKAINH